MGLWRVVTHPFRFIFNLIAMPFRALYRRYPKFFNGIWRIISSPYRFYKYLNTEPDDRPLTDVFADLIANQDTRQMLWDQVEAFRMHLLRSLLALILMVGVSFLFTQKILDFLAIPVGGVDKLIAIEVTESIGVFMKVALFSGIALAIPYIAFELWLFTVPGLRPRERKMALFGIPLASIFFIGGAAFTFYIMLPAALPFLNNFMGIKTELRPQSYFSFVTGLMFWVGVSFEFPLVIYVLSAIGLIQPGILVQQWRLAIVLITIAAAE